MALITQNESQYYTNEENSGSYQFTDLDTIINQFIISYVGEDKLISKVKKTDVAFHAQRAIQELSFDTFKSIKSQESVVPPSLRLMLPQDYVNYTNISWADSSGIQHTIYPTSKTSNPQSQGNLFTNGQLNEDAGGATLGTGWSWTNFVQGPQQDGGSISGSSVAIGEKIKIPVNVKMGREYRITFDIKHPDPVAVTAANIVNVAGNLKVTLYGDQGYKNVRGNSSGTVINYPTTAATEQSVTFAMPLTSSDINFKTTTDTEEQMLVIEPGTAAFTGLIDNITVTDLSKDTSVNLISKTWGNYRSHTPYNNSDNYVDDVHWHMDNERYGIDPQHAQINGSFFIDSNMLHLSSNLSGKTLIIKYLSDGLGKSKEMLVHKLAEEAVYKWIAYAIVSTRANMPQFQILRLKKERFAEIRKAKLRLSNIKLEELTQILRGKSKWIKH